MYFLISAHVYIYFSIILQYVSKRPFLLSHKILLWLLWYDSLELELFFYCLNLILLIVMGYCTFWAKGPKTPKLDHFGLKFYPQGPWRGGAHGTSRGSARVSRGSPLLLFSSIFLPPACRHNISDYSTLYYPHQAGNCNDTWARKCSKVKWREQKTKETQQPRMS